MTTDNLEKFQQKYLEGKNALERGNYRLSIENLEAALELIAFNSRRGGEAAIWLVTAYQAADKIDRAIELCQKLIVHPNTQTRQQAQHILYIIKAPKLERPPEWMSEIPNLADTDEGASRYIAAKKFKEKNPAELELEDLELPSTDVRDNQFVWFAFLVVAAIVGILAWMGW